MAVTITKPHAVAWIVWFPWWLPPSNHDQEENGVEAAEIEGESPYLIEEEFEVNESPMQESEREIRDRSSSGGVGTLSIWLFFLGRGGNCLLLIAAGDVGDSLAEVGKCLLLFIVASSLVGEVEVEGGCDGREERFDCLLECICTSGGSPFTVPGHGIATDTSLHWKCS